MMMMMMMMMMMIIIIILQRYKDKLAAALQKSTAYCKSAPSIVLAASKSSAGLIFGHCMLPRKVFYYFGARDIIICQSHYARAG
jgi:hypothetical protein